MTNPTAAAMTPYVILSQTRFFGELSPEQLRRVAALSRMESCGEGEQIYNIGEAAPKVYVLVRGTVRLAIGLGKRHVSAGDILRRGEVFGWAALTPDSSLRIATASCLSACRLLAVDGAGVIALMEEDHTLGYRLMTQLNRLITGTLTTFAAG
jgi:toluene monooxygenase system ferredoxin subunit